mgnify:FL=1|tara:strand:+ start:142 stop:297 length:156 start_codon:yes stop_codon:yes gene_type:complete
MRDLEHVKFMWQVLALRKRFGVNPYGLSKEELNVLENFDMTGPHTDGPGDP